MFESTYEKVEEPDPELRLRKSIPPFVKRRLVAVYRGRFCFKIPGVRCGPDETQWSRQRGQEETLQLGASTHGITIGYSRKHTHTDTITYKIGPYASVNPVWCHEHSELHVYEASSYLGVYRFRRQPKTFWPADPGFFHGNYVTPDPECRNGGAHGASPPEEPGPSPLKISGTDAPKISQLVEPVSFTRTTLNGGLDEPEEMAAAAAQLLEDDLVPAVEPDKIVADDWYSPGLLGANGEVMWLDAATRPSDQSASLVMTSAGCAARQRGYLSLASEERSEPVPILAFGVSTGATRAELRVIAEGEGGVGEVWSGQAAVREDALELPGVTHGVVVTTFWGLADLRTLPAGVRGLVFGVVYNESDKVAGELEVPFWTEEEPERVRTAEPAAASV